MSFDDLKRRLDELTRRFNAAGKKRAEFRGQLDATKDQLITLKKEIEAAGFDPKNLKQERDRLERELIDSMDSFEKELVEVETALTAIDKDKK